MRNALALSVLTIALVAPWASADALEPISFTLTLGSHHAPPVRTCDLYLDAPTDTYGLLLNALFAGCIESYQQSSAVGDHELECIDDVCTPRTAWALYVNETIVCPPGCALRDVQFLGGEYVDWVHTDRTTPYRTP